MEFKAEVFRRRDAYRAKQRQRRKRLLTTALCAALCITGLWSFAAMGRGGSLKNDSAMFMEDAAEMQAVPNAAPAEGESFTQNSSMVAGGAVMKTVTLKGSDAETVSQYLQGEWIDTIPNCASDYLVTIGDTTLRYHSACGTFTDTEYWRTLSVSEEARTEINGILEKYGQ